MSTSPSSQQKPRVGLIGLGRMGAAMAARLSGQGYAVSGWTRSGLSPDKARGLGIVVESDVAAAAVKSDVMLLSLSDDAAVTAVVKELCRGDLRGKVIVDTSTVGPDTLRRQAVAIAKTGGSALDAP